MIATIVMSGRTCVKQAAASRERP